jgi:FkbM family methyltransferase
MKSIFQKILGTQPPAALPEPAYRKSFSQHGEDLLVEYVMRLLHIERPFFIDIGAHHPYVLSNTYLMYLQGARGINVEPDPSLLEAFAQYRPEDINLQCGVRFNEITEADLYLMSAPVLNTFSREEAEHVAEYGTYKILGKVKVPLLSLQEIITAHCPDGVVDFMSIDVEGLDWEIIQYNQLDVIRPKVLCVETMQYSEDSSGRKQHTLIQYLQEKEYLLYADTHLNSIFVDKKVWEAR